MAQPEDKKPTPSTTETAADQSTRPKSQQPVQGKDADEYDPVGMAGKKAGIVVELGEEANKASKEVDKGPDAKDSAAIPAADKKY